MHRAFARHGDLICPLLVILACFCILASLIPEDLLARALVYVGDAGATSIDPHHSAARSYSLRETFMMFTTLANGRTTYGRAFRVKGSSRSSECTVELAQTVPVLPYRRPASSQ